MGDMPETRTSLVMRLEDHSDNEAWRQFVDLYGPLVYGLARRRGLRDADAADRMQDVLLSVARGIERYDRTRGPFRSWLYAVAMNKIRTFWQRLGRQREALAAFADMNERTIPDDSLERDYRGQLITTALERVRPEVDATHWRVFWSTTVEGTPCALAAQECGVKVDQVYVIRNRVRHKIAAAIRAFEEEEFHERSLSQPSPMA